MNDNYTEKGKNLEKAIVEAIAFFDLFDFPLMAEEVWRFIGVKCNLDDVRSVLETLNTMRSKDNFYFLSGREEIVSTRQKRNIYTERKFKRARMIAKIFQFIPWVKMIAVSNIIGERNLKDESDIDLFIITENKKIWLTRFFCAGLAKVLRMRPEKGNERDKICLNFYVSEEAMDVKNLMLQEENMAVDGASGTLYSVPDAPSQDIYFKYWLVNLAPIYEVNNAYKKFIQANDWIKNYFPNWQPEENNGRVSKNKPAKFNLLNLFFGRLENYAKKLQLKMMPKEMKEMMNKDTRVVVNDKVLKLHVNDRRYEYRERFLSKISSLLSS